jgi:multiple sugar transport system permease protein
VSARSRLPALLTLLAVAAFLGPFVLLALVSLQPPGGGTATIPASISLESWRSVFAGRSFGRALANSFAVAGATTLLALVFAAPAAFAIAKLELRGRTVLLAAALATSMFPPIAIASPLFLALRAIGLRDSLAGLVPPYVTFSLPLALWILTTQFRAIPDELYRAARVDGCSAFGAFRRVLLPVAAPGLATTAILVFVVAWNELLFALTFVSSPEKRTVPVAISLFASGHLDPWTEIAAASIAATVPIVALVLLFQRRIVAGLTAGSVKG